MSYYYYFPHYEAYLASLEDFEYHSEAWMRGYEAWFTGASNPYKHGTQSYSDWVEGYNEAYRD